MGGGGRCGRWSTHTAERRSAVTVGAAHGGRVRVRVVRPIVCFGFFFYLYVCCTRTLACGAAAPPRSARGRAHGPSSAARAQRARPARRGPAQPSLPPRAVLGSVSVRGIPQPRERRATARARVASPTVTEAPRLEVVPGVCPERVRLALVCGPAETAVERTAPVVGAKESAQGTCFYDARRA